MQKKLITEEQFEQEYKKRIDSGFYKAEADKVQKALESEVARLRSRYANNDLDRLR